MEFLFIRHGQAEHNLDTPDRLNRLHPRLTDLVLDGCSKLMADVFGEHGSHARSVFGAVSVRDNLPIIVDSIFEAEEEVSA
ncbi:hypothetical protein [Saccharibacillus deserti]|uniref:hypothetical protein n=1 Tax=Saccharibacillus deserti TaxID=1634444 RepID=UPI003CCCFE2E